MKKNLKKAVAVICVSMCFAGVFGGCSGEKSSKNDANAKSQESTIDESESMVVEDVKEFEVEPGEKSEFSFEGAQGEGEGN